MIRLFGKDIKRICVFCGSSSQVDSRYFDAARSVGSWLTTHDIELVYGAGKVGLMGCVAESVMSGGGKATGVIPRFMVDAGWCNERVSRLVVTEDMHTRKALMHELSDAFIVLPGGIGTAEELLEAITWKQLGLTTKPIVLVNTGGYFDPLLLWLNRMVEEHFMRDVHKGMWTVARSAEELDEVVKHIVPWDASVRKIAAI